MEDYIVEKQKKLNARFTLQVISLLVNVAPVLLMLLMGLRLIIDNIIIDYFCLGVAFIWMATGFGALFHLVGIALAIVYLFGRGKRTVHGAILSIVSILFPFILWFILITFEMVHLSDVL